MREDTGLRFYLRDKLMRMRYGYNQVIEGDNVREAWPPIQFKPSLEEMTDLVEKLTTPNSHAPDIPKDKTTDERIKEDLDDSFTWYERAEDGDYVFHRKGSACPKCRGRKQLQKRSINTSSFDAPISPGDDFNDTFEVIIEQCDCEPLKDNANE